MNLLAIATAAIGLLCIVGRGGFLIAPDKTVAFYKLNFADQAKVRIFGTIFLALGTLMVFGAQSPEPIHAAFAGLIEFIGWLVIGGGVVLITIPKLFQWLAEKGFGLASTGFLRIIGLLNILIGTFLVGLALFWL